MQTQTDIDGVRDQVQAFLAGRPDLTFWDLAAHTPLANSTCRHFLDGRNLSAGHGTVAREFTRALLLARAGDILPAGARTVEIDDRAAAPMPRLRKPRSHYAIETSKKIATTLTYCAEHALIGVITADYGAGKTRSVEAWRRAAGKSTESWVYEFNECTARNMVGFLHSLGDLLDVRYPPGTQKAHVTMEAIRTRLIAGPGLLIFDQCEGVSPRVMQVIRQVWDATRDAGVGVVLLGAPVLMERLRASRIADLGALSSRVGIWAQLRGLAREEMPSIVRAEGVTEVDGDALTLWWKAVGGSMRRLMMSLELIKSKHAGKPVTEKTIVQVAGHLWGMTLRGAE